MSKKRKKQAPIEFPSRGDKAESSPVIDDVVTRETLNVKSTDNRDNITEVVTTETIGDK